jgi:2-aminoethylphosphonate-pyruvate transaminase
LDACPYLEKGTAMNPNLLPDNPYVLLTPGPLSTSKSVKSVMLRDWCTWDVDYNLIVQDIRGKLVRLATQEEGYTAVLMQGSGTFSVEATISTAVPVSGKLLVLTNGAYGRRIAQIADRCGIPHLVNDSGEKAPPDLTRLKERLAEDASITHVAVVHCETTTGMLNPVKEIGEIVAAAGRLYIIDAMSSFGGIPMEADQIHADYLISSANKCIQGVPGFGFVVAKRDELVKTERRSRSLSLDLYDQWATMESQNGKWRFTSPTHVVRAFAKALEELESEGGVINRYRRYSQNHEILLEGMQRLGFEPLLSEKLRSPIITAFHSPRHPDYEFMQFYHSLKEKGFVIYPGKVTDVDTFRIGTIGDIGESDMHRLIQAVEASIYWL